MTFGTLITFLFINLSMVKLRRSRPEVPRPFRVPLYPFPPVLGIVTCIGLMLFLNPNALLIGGAWVLIGYAIYRRSRRAKELTRDRKRTMGDRHSR